jgi:cytochrome c oxidase subunit II
VGRQMLVQLEASDVIHNFWVPELAPKKDMVPGHQNTIWLAADRAGTFLGVCAEFCGAQHAWMRMLVIAEPEADFQAWQQRQMDVPAAPATDLAAEGARLYQDLTCINCHAIAGVGGDVGAGPDLTHLMSRQTLGAGTIANTPENLARWIANPHEFKPAVFMPPYAHWLTDEQLRALVAYLETLR